MEGDIKDVIKFWMKGELESFIKVWLSVYISLSYCYVAGKFVPKGKPRLFIFLPVISLFLALPLNLHSMHLGGITAFFVAWLANFKLLLFAFGKGPLSDSSVSLLRFIALACLPIKIRQNPPPNQEKFPQNKHNPNQNGHFKDNPSRKTTKNGQIPALNYAIKGLLLALIIRVYDYSEYIHPKVIMVIYAFHIYFCLEIILAIAAAMARSLLGLELEPQFNEPYLSSSLQDFWGRWNIMVSRILRPTVYDPVLLFSTQIVGRKWAPLPAVLATFVVSGVMHELIFYYLGRVRPTWEITWFFLIHGLCLVVEIAIKKSGAVTRRLPWVVAWGLTVGFVMLTTFWLFFPQLLRCKADDRAFAEYVAVGAFVKDLSRALTSKSYNTTRA